ncbi:MAG: alpha/beta fold hydrolase [Alphaproteobacteria bacterium]|nr:alpha/beta fold hydrolase [Alphaproteobacteria bacterium]NDC55548.1 alpha/beta fold hydrolase [Alphaproteobacteria bacterium]
MPEVLFAGPAGRLEGRYKQGKSPTAPIAIILHPHPQHGGTMNNKVCYAMYNIFAERDFSVMRFNFRGVGRSQGRYDRGEGELSDAAAAMDWLLQHNKNPRSIFVAGFSFGAWIGMQLLMRRPEIDSFISIAPPANMLDFTFLAPCPTSGLIVHGDQDEIVPEMHVGKLINKLTHQRDINIDYRIIKGGDHFFNNHLNQLNDEVADYVDAVLYQLPLQQQMMVG